MAVGFTILDNGPVPLDWSMEASRGWSKTEWYRSLSSALRRAGVERSELRMQRRILVHEEPYIVLTGAAGAWRVGVRDMVYYSDDLRMPTGALLMPARERLEALCALEFVTRDEAIAAALEFAAWLRAQ